MSGPFAAVPRAYLRDQAYDQLKDAIVSGQLPPGQVVVLDDLARQLSLSTMPVREAVARLVHDGLIESLPRRAHRVTPIEAGEPAALADVMATVTVRVYELGAPKVDSLGRAFMAESIEAHDVAMAAGELQSAVRAVEAFHSVVFHAADNPEYTDLLTRLVPRWERVMLVVFPDAIEHFGPDVMGPVLAALEAHRPADAVDAVRHVWAEFARTAAPA